MWKVGDMIQGYWEVLDVKTGGMGIVYIVQDHRHSESAGKPVFYAAKTMKDAFLNDTASQQFEREAYTWMKLGTYIHIVRAVFVERIKGQPYVFSEAVLTKHFPNTLRGWISKEPLPLPISVLFALQFCMGMEYAKLKGLNGHFDIKPENVMVTDEGIVKITDWGLARLAAGVVEMPADDLSSSPHHFLMPQHDPGRGGTLPYMAPEIWANADISSRVDIYAFGVMTYEMLAGRLPFTARTVTELREAHLHTVPAPPRKANTTIPQMLSDLCMACLEKNAENRPPNFVAIKEDLSVIFRQQTGQEFPTELEVREMEGAEASMAAYGLHSLGRDDEAMELMGRALGDLKKGPAVMMWDDKELGWSFSIPQELLEKERAKLRQDPQDPDPWAALANMYAMVQKHDEAIEHYERAIQLAPDRAGEWQPKIESIRQRVPREKARLLVAQGDNLAQAGRYREAQEFFDEAIRLDPDNALAWYNLGVCQMEFGDATAALNYFDKATSLDPKLVEAWSNRGALLNQLGRAEEALQSLERACQINPEHAKMWLNKGGALMSLGRLDEAVECFDTALKIDPGYTRAQQAREICVERMRAGTDPVQVAFDAFQRADSVDTMRRVVAQYPFMADSRFVTIIKQVVSEQVPPALRPLYEQRLGWLQQITGKQQSGFWGRLGNKRK